MSNLFQNNIFFKQNKEKFNPDVIEKKKNLENEFSINIFKTNNIVYNGIIDKVPENIKSSKDLEIEKDSPIKDYQQIINNKCKERNEQDLQFKPNKQKIIVDQSVEMNNNYATMKEENNKFINNQNRQNNNKLDNILENLKDLGILE
jgi:hypothetical protein